MDPARDSYIPAVIPQALAATLSRHDSLLVAFSGGVDSAVLAVAARQVLGGERMLAAIGVSPSLPALQLEQARAIAGQWDVPLREVPTAELDDPDYAANAPDRCYFCKRELWTRLSGLAAREGYAAVADGTIADDESDHRPGRRAGAERGVVSPLAEAGFAKTDVRALARSLGLPIWDAPAAPCLSSRVLYGIGVTPERLRQVEAAETFLRGLGVTGDLRVRHRGEEARIEVEPAQFARVRASRSAIAERLRDLGFAHVTLDLAGYRRGSFLRGAAAPPEPLTDGAAR
jgi:pyridinium-3,5-biscarboxylic acid mononucleotide sulfurtransferase